MIRVLSKDPRNCESSAPELELVTRMRKTNEVVKLEFQGVKLNLSKDVKYLGVILEDKLMWKAHTKN